MKEAETGFKTLALVSLLSPDDTNISRWAASAMIALPFPRTNSTCRNESAQFNFMKGTIEKTRYYKHHLTPRPPLSKFLAHAHQQKKKKKNKHPALNSTPLNSLSKYTLISMSKKQNARNWNISALALQCWFVNRWTFSGGSSEGRV